MQPPGLCPAGGAGSGRKTLRLHWTEGKSEFYTPSGRVADTVWTKIGRELGSVNIDKQTLADLFETKTTELKIKVRLQHPLAIVNANINKVLP